MRHPIRALFIGVLAVGLAASGCSKNTGSNTEGPKVGAKKVIQDTKGTAKTPAAEVPGAKKGGTIHVLQDGAFDHTDPGQIYVSNALAAGTELFYRQLTGYIEDRNGGDLQLVGDLATNTGETTDNGKTWKYTLRDGIKFEDGTPITSKDIAYGVARTFSDFGAQGPQYIQNWLDPKRAYKGPYNGAAALPPGVTTPDDKTIMFSFADAHPDFPLAAAMTGTVPVPKAKDTKANYEFTFQSMGPYKLAPAGFKKDQSMTLVKNDNWDPKSDPIRHQYVDKWIFDFTVSDTNQTQRLLANTGDDQTAIMLANVPVELVAQVQNNADAQKRIVQGETPFVRYVAINTQRVTDVGVRRALNYAFDKDSYIKTLGGSTAGSPATTALSPTVPGFSAFNAYPAPKDGDVNKAKDLLKGKTVPSLNYCFANTATGQKVAAGVKVGLERAGFKIVLQPTDRSSYYTVVGRKDNKCDLIVAGWAADYPDASTTIAPLFDGTTIVPTGNQNLSYFNQPDINDKIHKLATEIDRAKAGKAYAALDKEIMEKYAPWIPTLYDKQYGLVGSNVGGMFLDPLYGQPSYLEAYVK